MMSVKNLLHHFLQFDCELFGNVSCFFFKFSRIHLKHFYTWCIFWRLILFIFFFLLIVLIKYWQILVFFTFILLCVQYYLSCILFWSLYFVGCFHGWFIIFLLESCLLYKKLIGNIFFKCTVKNQLFCL